MIIERVSAIYPLSFNQVIVIVLSDGPHLLNGLVSANFPSIRLLFLDIQGLAIQATKS